MISARHSTTRARSLAAIVLASGIVASLAACASDPVTDGCTGIASGDASSLVTATGDFGTQTTADFPTPLITDGKESSVIDRGDGEYLQAGDYVDFQISVWDAASGDYVTGTSFEENRPSRGAVGGDEGGFADFFVCAQVGSRIAITSTLEDLFGDVDASAQGLDPDSTLVAVADVVHRIPGKADGADQIPQAGFPSVVTAPDGTPGVTIPNQAAPTSVESTVLKAGDGDVVEDGDIVALNYETLAWGSPGSVIASSWEDGIPQNYLATAYDPDTSGSLFPGVADAVIGAKVGSQVLVVVPPESSYPGDATDTDGGDPDATRIYVIDILAVID